MPSFAWPAASVDEREDLLESQPTASELSSAPLVLESPHRRPFSTSRRRSASRRPAAHFITITYVLGTADDAKQVLESEVVKEIVGTQAYEANVVDLAGARQSKSKTESEVEQVGPDGKRKHDIVGSEGKHDVG